MADRFIISVVMGIYNAAADLRPSLESILLQNDVALELVVVDDGSTDETSLLLDVMAQTDDRIRVLRQDNHGLTAALIRGCREARGRYIARQDIGDRSLPGRLQSQVKFLERNPDVVMVSCATRNLGPGDEELFVSHADTDKLNAALHSLEPKKLRGPSHHGATMFRRAAYEAAGGYRSSFRVAQDLDLWTRLAEQGICASIPEVLYEATWRSGAISHLNCEAQRIATQAIAECARYRREGVSEGPVLRELERKLGKPRVLGAPSGLVEARFYYYIGSLLLERNRDQAAKYFRQATKEWPPHAKAWAKLLPILMRRS